jgi:anti-sigma factor RsiW
MNCHDAHAVMHGYLDGECDPSVSLQYEHHVAECPACAKAVAEQQAIQAEMKADLFYYKAPQALRDRLHASLGGQHRTRFTRFPSRWLAAAAGVAACIGLGFLLARLAFAPAMPEPLAQEIASAHIRSLQADHLVDVRSSDRHTVKPWFTGKLDFAPQVADLAQEGFPLVGGRLDYLEGRTVAALVYRRRNHDVNLFIWPASAPDPTEIRRETRQGYQLIHWSKAGMNYWLVSDLDPTELNELAERLSKR